MPVSAPADGFRLAYERAGAGPPAVLLHGWPGWRADYRNGVPTTVLWGEHEPPCPAAWADRVGEFHADVALQVLPGVGHFAPLEAPAAVAEATARALPP